LLLYKRVKFFIIIKDKSERVPNKNFLDLGGKPLYKHLLDELKAQDVYVDTDSQIIFDELKDSEIGCYKRKQEFIDLENSASFKVSPVLLMIDHFLDTYVEDENEIIITPHVTSPFIKLSTMISASEMIHKGYDSVQACTKHYEFTYFQGNPVNFDPKIVQKTQDLEPIIMGNGAFFIFTKKMFKKNCNRVGDAVCFYPLEFPENIEIDYKEDLRMARAVYGK
jgi:CMP-N-acetylneuraminic acid synthetase